MGEGGEMTQGGHRPSKGQRIGSQRRVVAAIGTLMSTVWWREWKGGRGRMAAARMFSFLTHPPHLSWSEPVASMSKKQPKNSQPDNWNLRSAPDWLSWPEAEWV